MRSRLLHPLGILWTSVEGVGIYTSKLPCRAVICKLNFCCRGESALETYVTCDLWFYYSLLHFHRLFCYWFYLEGSIFPGFPVQMMCNFTANVVLRPSCLQNNFFLLKNGSCLPQQSEMPLSELVILSLCSVVPQHQKDQFPLLGVICVEELPRRARWYDLEVSVEENSSFFSGTIWVLFHESKHSGRFQPISVLLKSNPLPYATGLYWWW